MDREKKSGIWCCLHCHQKINFQKEKYVSISTFKPKGFVQSEYYFHMNCWKDYFNKCVLDKAKSGVEVMQKRVMGLVNNPMIKEMLSKVRGSDELLQIAQTSLNPVRIVKLKGQIEDLQNGKRKTGRKARRK